MFRLVTPWPDRGFPGANDAGISWLIVPVFRYGTGAKKTARPGRDTRKRGHLRPGLAQFRENHRGIKPGYFTRYADPELDAPAIVLVGDGVTFQVALLTINVSTTTVTWSVVVLAPALRVNWRLGK